LIKEHWKGARGGMVEVKSTEKIVFCNCSLGKATETNWLVLRGGRVVNSEEGL
jgi:hypothetical protein